MKLAAACGQSIIEPILFSSGRGEWGRCNRISKAAIAPAHALPSVQRTTYTGPGAQCVRPKERTC